MNAKPVKLEIYRCEIPMRSFEHAAAKRNVAKNILVKLTYDTGEIGWGETLPRDYVTGETLETVPVDLESLWEICLSKGTLNLGAETLPEEVPTRLDGRFVGAAACCLDLASAKRIFTGDATRDRAILREIAGIDKPRNYIPNRVSGVLGSADPAKTEKRLKLMLLGGLRDFKIKLGLGEEIDRQNLEVVRNNFWRKITRSSMRVDVNGAWALDEVLKKVEELSKSIWYLTPIEQPTYCDAKTLAELAKQSPRVLLADESLLCMEDAKILATANLNHIAFSVRISKMGGILPALKIMRFANSEDHQLMISSGCMVGETSILSAAQRKLLAIAPHTMWIEGNWGTYLLSDDILPGKKSLRFGYGGKLKPIKGAGLGIEVCPEKIEKYATLIKTLRA